MIVPIHWAVTIVHVLLVILLMWINSVVLVSDSNGTICTVLYAVKPQSAQLLFHIYEHVSVYMFSCLQQILLYNY